MLKAASRAFSFLSVKLPPISSVIILLASKIVPRVFYPLISLNNTVFCPGFVIKSPGFTFVPTLIVTNLFGLEAPRVHKFCMSTRFALPSPQGLAKHVVAVASRCRFNAHATPKVLRHALNSQIPLARCSLWRTVRFHQWTKIQPAASWRKDPSLLITPADTDRRVTWSPPQSEFWAESVSPVSSVCL